MTRDWRDSYDTVRVWTRTQTGSDSMGEPVYAWSYQDVRGVSVKTGTRDTGLQSGDAMSDLRPDGIRVKFTLSFPKGHGLTLRHARVTFPDRGQTATTWQDAEPYALMVSGDPQPQRPCPTVWDTIAEVGRTDG
ncbi:MAG: hypothetical protein IKG21_13190 [Atopobiaceae bacterium]|nr:hypothetical protein [Atopobiaceae bacterium]